MSAHRMHTGKEGSTLSGPEGFWQHDLHCTVTTLGVYHAAGCPNRVCTGRVRCDMPDAPMWAATVPHTDNSQLPLDTGEHTVACTSFQFLFACGSHPSWRACRHTGARHFHAEGAHPACTLALGHVILKF